MANKMEAVLSFKLDDKGLKDAAKELEQLKKQLDDLSKQKASTDTKTPAGQAKAGQLDTRIKQTQRAIEAGEALMGQGPKADDLKRAFQDKLKGRNPGRMITDNIAEALHGAIKSVFGDLGEAFKNPVTKSHFEQLIEQQAGNLQRQNRTPSKGKRAAAQLVDASDVTVAGQAATAKPAPATEPEPEKPAASRPSEAAPDKGPMVDRKDSGLPQYMKEQMDQNYGSAKSMNLVDPIIQHAASGMTKREITDLLAKQMPGTDRSFLEDAVTAVRSRHSIPSNGALSGFNGGVVGEFDPNEFPNWQKGYMERMGQTPAPNQVQQTGPGLLPEVPPATTPVPNAQRRKGIREAIRDSQAKQQRERAATASETVANLLEEIPEPQLSKAEIAKRDRAAAAAQQRFQLRNDAKSMTDTALERANRWSPTMPASALEADTVARQLRGATSMQQSLLGASQKAGDTEGAAEATDQLKQLAAAAQKLKDAFVGTIKPTNNMADNLSAVEKKSELLAKRDDLLARFKDEKNPSQRQAYARDLNANANQLQGYISDADEKRKLRTETDKRNEDEGVNQNVLNTFGQFLAGNVLLQTGRTMRQPYNIASQAFNQYNQENQVDPALLTQQRRLNQGLIDMGGSMRSYEALKLGVGTAAVQSPFAAPLAAAGEVGGAAFGAAGSMLQTGASLSMAGASAPWLSKALKLGSGATLLGGAALAGGAVGMGLGSLISPVFNNGKQKDPFDVLRMMFQPTQSVQDKTEQEIGAKVRVLQGPQLKQVEDLTKKTSGAFSDYDKAKEQQAAYRSLAAAEGPRPQQATLQLGIDADKNLDKAKEDMKKYAQDLAKAAGAPPITEEVLKDPERLRGFVKYFENVLDTTNIQKLLTNNPQLKLQRQQMQNQWNDFTVDMARQTFQLNRNFTRSTEDLSRTRTRSGQDFNTQLGRLGVTRGRAAEDRDVAMVQNDRGIERTRRNINTQLQRADADYVRNQERLLQDSSKSQVRTVDDTNKQVYRLYRDVNKNLERTTEDAGRSIKRTQEDTARSWARTIEDSARSSARLVEDTSRTSQRLVEDTTRTMVRAQEDASMTIQRSAQDRNTSGSRLMEDTGVSRQRLAQDYNRTVQQQNRNYVRSNQDLDQGYQDSVLGIVAPGLTSNPGYQLARLSRDYAKNKTRLGEDYKTGREDLNISTDRQFADLAKSLQRGIDDLNKSFERTVEDVNKSLQRTTEDIATALQRSGEDIATALQRSAEDINTTLQRAGEDIATTMQRAGEDFATTMQRAKDDAATALSDGMTDITTNFQRTMDDLNTSLQRATEDMDLEHYRNYQDAMRELQDAEVDYQTNRADIQRSYNRTVEDLNNAEFDLRRDYNRNVEDLNTEAKRMKEDFAFARDQLKIETDRFQRDFQNSLAQFTQSLSAAANATVTAVQAALNAAVVDIQNAGAAQQAAIAAAAAAGAAGGGTAPTGPVTPGAAGMDQIPFDEFPAFLHKNEMVVTREEAEPLYQAGYRPESRNLKQILPKLLRDALPKFAGGWNGTSILQPGMDPGFHRDVAAEQWVQQASIPGSWTMTPYDYTNDPHGNNDYSDPSLRNPTWANWATPGWHTPGETMGFPSKEAFYAANPQWVPNSGSEWLKQQARSNYGAMTQIPWPGNDPSQGNSDGTPRTNSGSGGIHQTPSHTTSTIPMGYSDPGTAVQVMSLDAGQKSYSLALESLYSRMRTATTPAQRAALQTEGDAITGRYRSGGFAPDPSVYNGFGAGMGNPLGYQSSSDNRGGIGTGQGLTKGANSGIINASIVPPVSSVSARSYGTSLGNMSISVQISGGSAQAQAVVNQAVNAFGRDLTNRSLSLV
jgi:hypothetical protein